MLQSAIRNLGAISDATNPLFSMCYDFIIEDLYAGQVGAWHDTKDGREQVWDRVQRLPLWERKGSRAALSGAFGRLVGAGASRRCLEAGRGKRGGRGKREGEGGEDVPSPGFAFAVAAARHLRRQGESLVSVVRGHGGALR